MRSNIFNHKAASPQICLVYFFPDHTAYQPSTLAANDFKKKKKMVFTKIVKICLYEAEFHYIICVNAIILDSCALAFNKGFESLTPSILIHMCRLRCCQVLFYSHRKFLAPSRVAHYPTLLWDVEYETIEYWWLRRNLHQTKDTLFSRRLAWTYNQDGDVALQS